MTDGMAELDAMIARCKALGAQDVGARIARRAAPLVDDAVKVTVRAGTDPLGRPWKPKKDGGRALVNAAAHIATRAAGNLVVVILSGADVWHHKGLGNSPRRQVIPDAVSVPAGVWKAMREGARRVVDDILAGRA